MIYTIDTVRGPQVFGDYLCAKAFIDSNAAYIPANDNVAAA